MTKDKELNKSKGIMIFALSLFCIFIIITILAAVGFEYYTVKTSHGEVIFSVGMSWQMILFTFETATLIIQSITLILMLKKATKKRYNIFRVGGITAGAVALITVIVLFISDGLVINPTIVFLVYSLVIVIGRSIFIPYLLYKNLF